MARAGKAWKIVSKSYDLPENGSVILNRDFETIDLSKLQTLREETKAYMASSYLPFSWLSTVLCSVLVLVLSTGCKWTVTFHMQTGFPVLNVLCLQPGKLVLIPNYSAYC